MNLKLEEALAGDDESGEREKEEKEELEKKERDREAAEEIEKQRKENERRENDLVENLTSKVFEKVADQFLDEALARVGLEWHVSEQVRDKLVNDELGAGLSRVSSTSSLSLFNLTRVCTETLEEARRESERAWRAELRARIEEEIFERVVLGNNLAGLIRECCERVVWEERTERALDIYESVLGEVVSDECMDSIFLEMIFEETIGQLRPFIKKIETKPPKPAKQPPPVTMTTPVRQATKRAHTESVPTQPPETSLVVKRVKTTSVSSSQPASGSKEWEDFETDPEQC